MVSPISPPDRSDSLERIASGMNLSSKMRFLSLMLVIRLKTAKLVRDRDWRTPQKYIAAADAAEVCISEGINDDHSAPVKIIRQCSDKKMAQTVKVAVLCFNPRAVNKIIIPKYAVQG